MPLPSHYWWQILVQRYIQCKSLQKIKNGMSNLLVNLIIYSILQNLHFKCK